MRIAEQDWRHGGALPESRVFPEHICKDAPRCRGDFVHLLLRCTWSSMAVTIAEYVTSVLHRVVDLFLRPERRRPSRRVGQIYETGEDSFGRFQRRKGRTCRACTPSSEPFTRMAVRCMQLTRPQLDILGIATGFLPRKPPFSLALPSDQLESVAKDPKAKRGSMTITRPELLSSLEEEDTLYDLYVNVTNRAIELYASAGRRKFALKLHGTLAALDVCVRR